MKSSKNNFGFITIWLLAIIPVVLWFSVPNIERFNNWQTTFLSIAQLTALMGYSLFAINLFLSARLKFLEKYFKGLNDLYKKHSFFGKLAIIFLVFHFIFLNIAYYPNSLENVYSFSVNAQLGLGLGELALFSSIAIIALTIFWRPRFDVWKRIHQLFGIAFIIATFHMLLVPTSITSYPPIRIYLLTIGIIAIVAYVYRTVLGKFLVPRHKFEIHQITKLPSNVISIVLKPVKEKMNFTAGQFGFIHILGKIIKDEEHPFSFTSDPNSEELSLAIKQVGDYTKELDKLEIGTPVEVEGPFGIFSYKNSKHTNQIWIAGGIGITPFLSMLQDIKNESNYKVDLYYCVKNESEAVFLDQISNLAKTVRVIPFYSEKEGHITATEIAKRSNGLENKDIFVCAPPAMIKDLKKQFISLGVNPDSIKSEEFEL